ncbi:MAG: restriction endonuclease [Prosthecobacter sp.]|uniref:restriction endonuclease n=1 Tax=Prosthecobacter sp. TaxID=1965333 RepID=UPI0019FB30D5|nr:restriction endonuclease [Prosthecobacter sp.]MBE2283576.1 restriction endonuclease [Prosthecobacter sp.]
MIGCLWGLGWLLARLEEAKRYRERKARLDRVEEDERKNAQEVERLCQVANDVQLLAKQKSTGFPWLADAYADYFKLQELKIAEDLERKARPARKAAEEVRAASQRRRQAEREARVLRYQLLMFEKLFPWLSEFKEEGIDDEMIRVTDEASGYDSESDDDRALKWLTPEEFARLPTNQKYQLALDRYRSNRRSKWEVGRDYERFIGYQYERDGFDVTYHGIEEGLDDMGRDLICKRDNRVVIVQCKCWSADRPIHEKHIFQLFGTVKVFQIDHPSMVVSGHFVTSTRLSPRAKVFADSLAIKTKEDFPLREYPCIKCNISPRGGEKIYHLPFDQQYDRTKIIPNSGEFYAMTVVEAEKRGFRRAFRYRGGGG